MIIELTGLPGSGKTTLLCEFRKTPQQPNECFLFAKDKILKSSGVDFLRHNRLLAGIALDIILLFVFFANYTKCKHIFHLARHYVKTSGESVFCRLNLIRNIIKKLSIYHYCQHSLRGQNVLIDEGICHMAFNIFVDSGSRVVSDDEIEHFLNIIPWPDLLVVVEAPEDLITKRLRQRGHTRIDFENQQKYENFMNDCYRVLQLIKQHSQHNTIAVEVNTEEWRPIESIAQEVVANLRTTAVPQAALS